jgi:hypothetical protein
MSLCQNVNIISIEVNCIKIIHNFISYLSQITQTLRYKKSSFIIVYTTEILVSQISNSAFKAKVSKNEPKCFCFLQYLSCFNSWVFGSSKKSSVRQYILKKAWTFNVDYFKMQPINIFRTHSLKTTGKEAPTRMCLQGSLFI